jgi:hypothetical protein
MNVGDSVRMAIKDYEGGEVDSAMMHACNSVDGTAAKLHPNLGSNARFTKLLRDGNYILEPMAAPGINLEQTRWPVKVKYSKAPGGLPDYADIVYGIHRCCHGHGEALPAGFELASNASGQPGSTTMHIERQPSGQGKVRLSDRVIFGLLVVAVLSPVNIDQRVPDGYHLTFGRLRYVLPISEWWGRAADFPAVAARESMPRVTLNFAHMMAGL